MRTTTTRKSLFRLHRAFLTILMLTAAIAGFMTFWNFAAIKENIFGPLLAQKVSAQTATTQTSQTQKAAARLPKGWNVSRLEDASDSNTLGPLTSKELEESLDSSEAPIFTSGDSLQDLSLRLKKFEEALNDRKVKLDARERELAEKEKRLDLLRKETEQNLARIDEQLKKMQQVSAEAEQQRRQDIGKWVKIYEAMKPDKAGKVFDGLEMPLAAEILARMMPKKAGKILENVEPKRAVEIGELVDQLRAVN